MAYHRPSVGLELELWVIDRDGDLADGRPVIEALPFVDPEVLPPLIEVRTEPHRELEAVEEELRERIGLACAAADRAGLRLFCHGTPFHSEPLGVVEGPRLAIQQGVDPPDVFAERALARDGLDSPAVRDYFERMGLEPDADARRDEELLLALHGEAHTLRRLLADRLEASVG